MEPMGTLQVAIGGRAFCEGIRDALWALAGFTA